MRGGAFSKAVHLLALREEMCDVKKNRDGANDATLKGLFGGIKGTDRHLIIRANNICAWMKVHSTMVTGTVLFATEFL